MDAHSSRPWSKAILYQFFLRIKTLTKKSVCSFIILLSQFFSPFLFCIPTGALTLNEYRNQVQKSYSGIQATQDRVEGTQIMEQNLPSITDFQLFAQAFSQDDKRPTTNPSFQGTRTLVTGAALGVRKQFSLGPKMELGQHISHTRIYDAASSAIPVPDYYETYPKISLVIPLWRNFSGEETQATDKMNQLEARNHSLQAQFEDAQLNVRIEKSFFSLAAARENLSVQKEILERAHRLLNWAQSQYQRSLVDSSDFYQAQAAVTSRTLQVQNAETLLENSQREFNLLRGINEDNVNEDLQVSELPLDELKLHQQNSKRRLDLLVQSNSTEIQELTQIKQIQMIKPTLDLTTEAQWNGRDPELSEAQRRTYKDNTSLLYVGLQFSMALDFPRTQKYIQGLKKLDHASSASLASIKSDQDKIWSDFVTQGQTIFQQLQLMRQLEVQQKQKADAERIRLNSGRSTTFQVLSFEQDYSEAKGQRINLELSAHQFLAQKLLFID